MDEFNEMMNTMKRKAEDDEKEKLASCRKGADGSVCLTIVMCLYSMP